MAIKVQCDGCGCTYNPQECKVLIIRDLNPNGTLNDTCVEKDLCPTCYSKVEEVLNRWR